MGFALALEAANQGAHVILIAGPVQLQISHPNITRIDVTSAQQMCDAALQYFPCMDAAILSAAVADFTPITKQDKKIKEKQHLTIELQPTPDIAIEIGKLKTNQQIVAGFALETHDEIGNAQTKLIRKNFDFIVLNSLADPGAGFGYDTNKITIIDVLGNCTKFELKQKNEVAKDIINILASLFT
jgi:phosphopantothenoylcysteine decarboxylase/phosphopantothenate--cysteine ligase